ncbi:MRG-domain-containing protein [Scheffersomyces xylosifermentans]|uniref:MRG-domain-containing protein n=1 Tax=Scheffersomyces xylosifermentans TaxID=1304137 RepID=UPI00315D7287
MTDFKPNTAVYAYHGPLIYEAKILKVHRANDSHVLAPEGKKETLEENPKLIKYPDLHSLNTYLLHYQGWNSKWDEWVTIERILEYNEENKFKKKELDQLNKKKRAVKKTTPIASTTTPNTSTTGSTNTTTTSKKRDATVVSDSKNGEVPKKRSKTTATSSNKKSNPLIQLEFNKELKYLLINDWEYITRDRKIVELPSKKPISSLLQDYRKFRSSQLSTAEQIDILQEILMGLELYFNKSLSLTLLYKYENLQYLNFLKQEVINSTTKSQSKVYGVEHLLRLLISLPGLISQTTMDNISISVLINELTELLRFITDNLPHYANEYVNTTPQYDSLARS